MSILNTMKAAYLFIKSGQKMQNHQPRLFIKAKIGIQAFLLNNLILSVQIDIKILTL